MQSFQKLDVKPKKEEYGGEPPTSSTVKQKMALTVISLAEKAKLDEIKRARFEARSKAKVEAMLKETAGDSV